MISANRIIDFRYSPEVIQSCIGFVDDAHKSIVREDGSINYNFNGDANIAFIMKGVDQFLVSTLEKNRCFRHRYKPEFHHRDQLLKVEQSYGNPKIAIVNTTEIYKNTDFSWKTFAYKNEEGLRADIMIWSLSVSGDFGHAKTSVKLVSYGEMQDGPKILGSKIIKTGINSEKNDEFIYSNGKMEGVFVFVLAGEIKEEVTLEWAKAAEESTINYWMNVNPFKERFEIPDQQIMDMIDSCGRNILQAREIKEEVYEFQVGPTMYRGLWVVDGHFFLEAAQMMGRFDEAFQGIYAVLKIVKPNGSVRIIPQHDKETGIAIATICRQCELMNDDARLIELWPTICRGLNFIKSLREDAKKLGKDYIGYDLFPPAFGDGGMGYHAEYATPLWILFGLRSAYIAGKRLGLSGYEEFKLLFDEVMEGFIKATRRDMKKTENGSSYFPMCMDKVDYYKPQSATWAFAQAIFPGEVFSPNDEYVTNFLALLDEVDEVQGIPIETGFTKDQSQWAYSSMFYAQVWLYAGYPEKAVDYLYSFANHAAPNRVWIEEHYLKNSHSNEHGGDMPHNWASVEFIRMVRNLLVLEKGNNLELLAGLPKEWLPSEAPLVLENTPTKYGRITIELSSFEKGLYVLKYKLKTGNQIPEKLIIHGMIEENTTEKIIYLPGETKEVELKLKF